MTLRLRAAASLLLSAAACTAAPSDSAPSFEDSLQRHVSAVQDRNLADLEATITSGAELLLILPSGRMMQTREDYVAFHRTLFADTDWRMTFEPIERRTFGDYGHALYRVTFDPDGAGPAPSNPAYLSLGLALEEGEWRLVHDQNTPVPTAP